MRLATKIVVGVLLTIGLPITAMGTIEVLNPQTSQRDREGALAALVVIGLPPTAMGAWLIWSAGQRTIQQQRDRLRSAFFQLLQENNGHLTVLHFSMTTGLDGKAAQTYLDDRAKEFNALYNVTEEGNISYYFDLDGGGGKRLLEGDE